MHGAMGGGMNERRDMRVPLPDYKDLETARHLLNTINGERVVAVCGAGRLCQLCSQ